MAVYLSKELIEVCPFGRTLYFEKLKELKEQKVIEVPKGNYLSEQQAKQIAKALGFEKEFKEYLKTKK